MLYWREAPVARRDVLRSVGMNTTEFWKATKRSPSKICRCAAGTPVSLLPDYGGDHILNKSPLFHSFL